MNTATRALLLTIIGVGALLAVMYALSGGTEKLEPDARDFLDYYFGDEAHIMKAYNMTTAAFAVANEMRTFYDQRKYYVEVLGAYEGVADVADESVDPVGRGLLEMTLSFENGQVPATFQFLREKERWRIDDFEIDLPRKLAPKHDWVQPRNFGRTLSSRWAQDGYDGVWQLFTAPVRKVKDKSLFVERSAALLETLGEYKSVEDGTFDESNEDEPKMSYTIKFSGGDRRADVALVWMRGRWFVSHFEVEGLSLE